MWCGSCSAVGVTWQFLVDLREPSTCIVQGWRVLNQFPPIRYFPDFPTLSKQWLPIEYQVYIWHVSLQLSCGDTCQIWKWVKEHKRHFCKIQYFLNGGINERILINSQPWIVIAMRVIGQPQNFVSKAYMMTSSNVKHFPRHWSFICGEFTVKRWFPLPKLNAIDVQLWCSLWSAPWIKGGLNKQSWCWWFETPSCSLWRHYNAYLKLIGTKPQQNTTQQVSCTEFLLQV